MPRLFWKLFGAFWLTTVVILAASIFVSFQIADRDAAAALDPREADALLREVLDDSGVAGLRAWIADRDNFPPGHTVYVIDEHGRELLGRPVPQFLQRRARRLLEHVGRRAEAGRALRSGGPRQRFAPVLVTPDGARLLALPGPAPAPRFGVLSAAGMRWALPGIAALVSLLSFWLLSRSLLRPALRVSHAAARLAAGDMSARVGAEHYSADEIGALAAQFDRMAATLQAQAEQRRELFRNVSHELRAPLARLQIAAELLARKPGEAAVQLERIRTDLEALESLTVQVLELARAEQPALQGSARLAPLLERLGRDAAFEAQAAGVQLEWPTAAPDVLLAIDERLLASAIENVVRNALQATPAGGRVDVAVALRGGRLVIDVVDDGPGVPQAELDKLFAPFYRLDTNRPGAGIGLAITAGVVAQLQGQVEARNVPPRGLHVSLALPLSDRMPGPA